MTRRVLVVALLATLSSAAMTMGSTQPKLAPDPVIAPAKTGGILVLVTRPDGLASKSTLVEITRSHGNGIAKQLTTDKYGRAMLSGLEEDDYLVVAFNTERSEFSWHLVRVKAGRTIGVSLTPGLDGTDR